MLSRDQDRDLGLQVSRPRPRPWTPDLETETETWTKWTRVSRPRSRDHNTGIPWRPPAYSLLLVCAAYWRWEWRVWMTPVTYCVITACSASAAWTSGILFLARCRPLICTFTCHLHQTFGLILVVSNWHLKDPLMKPLVNRGDISTKSLTSPVWRRCSVNWTAYS